MQKSVVRRSTAVIALLIATLFVGLGLTGCADTSPIDMSNVTEIIDVRSASEYAEGHLEGAVNIDVESAAFADEVGSLDKAGSYVLYCRSGHRAGIALDEMTSMGFTNVVNAGGYADASARTGLPIVQ